MKDMCLIYPRTCEDADKSKKCINEKCNNDELVISRSLVNRSYQILKEDLEKCKIEKQMISRGIENIIFFYPPSNPSGTLPFNI